MKFSKRVVDVFGQSWQRDVYPLLIVALVSALALLPVAIYGLPNGADLWNHFRFALPFYEGIRAGDWYPGWLAESNAGLGDPRFRFYPPALYYLMIAGRFLTGDWYAGSIASIVVLSVLGGIGAYLWARHFFVPTTAMWAAILYSLAPYRLNEVYQAALLSEYAACSILPFTFVFLERVCRRKNASDVFCLAAAYALLILTNLPIAVVGSLALALYAVLRLERSSIISTLSRLAISVALGLAGGAFFWSTMIAELSWIKGNSSHQTNYYDYRVNFLFSPSALTNRNTWYANLLALAVIGFVMPALAFSYRFCKGSDVSLRAAFVLFVGSFLMATPLSRPVWAIVPKLAEIQFPWRWLSVTSLVGSLLVAASIPWWQERFRQLRPRDLAVILGFVLSIGFVATQVIYDCEYLGRAKVQPMLKDIRGAVSFKDWLPIWAKEFLEVERMTDNVKSDSRTTTVTSWEPEHRAFTLTGGPASTVTLRTYYYPHWTASMNGKQLPTSPSADGLLKVNIPAEAGSVEVNFREPGRVATAALVSAVAWLTMFFGCLFFWLRSTRMTRLRPQEENGIFPDVSVSSRVTRLT